LSQPARPLFVYGTLRAPEVLAGVLGRVVPAGRLRPATASGHRAALYPGRAYPAIVPARAEALPGLLVEGLSDAEIARLDAFEGDEYRRGPLVVDTGGGAVAADVYWPSIAIPDGAPGWTFEAFRREHEAAITGSQDGAKTLHERLIALTPPRHEPEGERP